MNEPRLVLRLGRPPDGERFGPLIGMPTTCRRPSRGLAAPRKVLIAQTRAARLMNGYGEPSQRVGIRARVRATRSPCHQQCRDAVPDVGPARIRRNDRGHRKLLFEGIRQGGDFPLRRGRLVSRKPAHTYLRRTSERPVANRTKCTAVDDAPGSRRTPMTRAPAWRCIQSRAAAGTEIRRSTAGSSDVSRWLGCRHRLTGTSSPRTCETRVRKPPGARYTRWKA
jgi:hypothetical protein